MMNNQPLINELRQHALMIANEIKRLRPLNVNEIERAYARVKTFDGVKCPKCWVTNEKESELIIDMQANEVNSYKCDQCGFNEILPKSD